MFRGLLFRRACYNIDIKTKGYSMSDTPIHIIGAGLAGSEAAWQIAEAGIPVIIHEMKPAKFSPAHKNPDCAELVCSNSFSLGRF